MFDALLNALQTPVTGARWLLWIDGAGTFLVLTASEVSIGRLTTSATPLASSKAPSDEAQIALMGNLSRQHATLRRAGDDYILDAHSATTINGRAVDREVLLPTTCELAFNNSVRINVSQPSPLSASARVDVLSGHRSRLSLNGIVLLAETCLLGPGAENHIRCPQWSSSLVLVRRNEGLSVKSREPLFVDGQPASGLATILPGATVVGPSQRFRVELLESVS